MKIFKFCLEVTHEQEIELPVNVRILTVQVQNKIPCLWAVVDEKLINASVMRKHSIRTFGTGQPFDLPIDCFYIGTYQLNGGSLVFHVFDEWRVK